MVTQAAGQLLAFGRLEEERIVIVTGSTSATYAWDPGPISTVGCAMSSSRVHVRRTTSPIISMVTERGTAMKTSFTAWSLVPCQGRMSGPPPRGSPSTLPRKSSGVRYAPSALSSIGWEASSDVAMARAISRARLGSRYLRERIRWSPTVPWDCASGTREGRRWSQGSSPLLRRPAEEAAQGLEVFACQDAVHRVAQLVQA
jgi:hypothetical protein